MPTEQPTAQVLYRAVPAIDVRAAADTETGSFEGIACVPGVRDSYGTVFAPGCWTAGGLDEDLYALLAMHNPTEPLGTFTAREDDAGLHIAGAWDDTALGRDWRTRARTGSAALLSVGFVPLMVDPDDGDLFTQCRLVEVSQITARMAAVPGAELTGVRWAAQLAGAVLPPSPRRDGARIAAARLRLASDAVTGSR